MNKYEIIITVDTNDGDDITAVNHISEEDFEKIKPLIESIKKFTPYKSVILGSTWNHRNNYPYGECCREDLGQKTPNEYYGFSREIHEMFEELCPYNEYGFHTIESVTIGPITEKITLL